MVEMVRVDVADPAPGVMLLGENEHFRELGRLLHERAIAIEDDPDFVAAVIRTLAAPPAGTVSALGEALNEIVVGVGVGVGEVGWTGVVLTVEGQLGR